MRKKNFRKFKLAFEKRGRKISGNSNLDLKMRKKNFKKFKLGFEKCGRKISGLVLDRQWLHLGLAAAADSALGGSAEAGRGHWIWRNRLT
jgi:hypothetical protein